MGTAVARAPGELDLRTAAAIEPGAVLDRLGTGRDGLDRAEAARRLREIGPNALRIHATSGWRVLLDQLRNPLLPLLVAAAAVSAITGQVTDAGIIVVMVAVSVGLGFANEFRSEKAVEELHGQIHHTTTAIRDGHPSTLDVTELVPGDLVHLSIGDVVPADVRLLEVDRFECDEAVLTGETLTGETLPAEKQVEPVERPSSPIDLPSCAFMGTVVKSGTARAVVVRTGPETEFGRIATLLGERPPETSFQRGLRDFGKLLVRITAVLVVGILIVNLAIGRPFIDAVLFSLAVAVGMTPELLPAIVTISLSTGAKRMATRSVLVRRLVAIEDFGNIQVLFTDKTGTLTEGRISYRGSLGPEGAEDDRAFALGLACTDVVLQDGVPTGGSPLDQALWSAPGAATAPSGSWRRLDEAAFDYERRRMSVLLETPEGRRIVTKGAPESVLAVCTDLPAGAQATVEREFDAGARLVAVAVRDASDLTRVEPEDERRLSLVGFLAFVDPPKADAADSLRRPRHPGEGRHRRQRARGPEGVRGPRRPGRADPHGRADRRHARRGARPHPHGNHDLRAGDRGAEVEDHPARTEPRPRRGLHGRRRERRGGAPRRGCRYLGRHRHRRREGCRRHPVAAQGPRDARRWGRRGPQDLREHGQVHPHGHVVELRQHVQGCRRFRLPEVPADAPEPDPPEQPAVRHEPDRDPHRPGRPGDDRPPGPMGHAVHPAVHDVLRPDQLAVRLRDLRGHAPRLPRGRVAVPNRLVRGVAGDADARHLRDPDPPRAVPAQPSEHDAARRHPLVRRRGRADPLPPTRRPPVRFTPLPWTFLLIVVAFVVAYLTLAELGKAWFFRRPERTRPPALHFEVLRRRRVRKLTSRWSRGVEPVVSGPIDGGSA